MSVHAHHAAHCPTEHRLIPAHGRLGPRTPALGGLTRYSSVDWPGKLSAVVFVAGCPWRCHYCHNPGLQQRVRELDWDEVLNFLARRRGLLDGVVFCGGEPLSEPTLPALAAQVRDMGFAVALHTAGIYPDRLAEMLPGVSWVGLDIKTDAEGYDALTGRARSHAPVRQSLAALLAHGVDFECRTTWSPSWLPEPALLALAETLAQQGVRHYAVQHYRPSPDALAAAPLAEATRQRLEGLFLTFEER